MNRLLLNNVDVRGVGWGAFALVRPGYMQEQWARLRADARRPAWSTRRSVPPTTSRTSAGRSPRWPSGARSASRWSGSVTAPDPTASPAHRQTGYRVRIDWGPTGAAAIGRRGRRRRGGRRAVVHHHADRRGRARHDRAAVPVARRARRGYAAEHDAVLAVGRLEAAAERRRASACRRPGWRAREGVERLVLPSPNGSVDRVRAGRRRRRHRGRRLPAQRHRGRAVGRHLVAAARWRSWRAGERWETARCARRRGPVGCRRGRDVAASAAPTSRRRRTAPDASVAVARPAAASCASAQRARARADAASATTWSVAAELDSSDVVPVLARRVAFVSADG